MKLKLAERQCVMMDLFILEDHLGIAVFQEKSTTLLYMIEAYLLMKLIHMPLMLSGILTLLQKKNKNTFICMKVRCKMLTISKMETMNF